MDLESIQRLATRLQGTRTDGRLSEELAFAFGWEPGTTRGGLRPALGVQITKGFISSQPASIFAVARDNARAELPDAALYAYHAAIPWGVVADAQGALVFNSHWVRDNDWFHLPLIGWGEIDRHQELFSGVSPRGVQEGRLDRTVAQAVKLDRILRPVDDALVERLDHWRDEALRYSKDDVAVDERLQTLFAQLFVLRTVEDRGLAPGVPSLRMAAAGAVGVDLTELRNILKIAGSRIGSELFDVDVVEHIPQAVLRGVIEDLYHPHLLPSPRARYNFAWLDADILGTAYEKYLSTVLSRCGLRWLEEAFLRARSWTSKGTP